VVILSPYDQAARYVAKCAPAISGQAGHDATFNLACTLVNGFTLSEREALDVLRNWNLSCQPPWKEHELIHKIADAARSTHDKPRGHKLSGNTTKGSRPVPVTPKPKPKPKIKYELKADDLPEAIPDGARKLISALFEEGEGIRIVKAKLNEERKEIPEDGGACLSREEWLKKLDKAGGNPNKFMSSSDRCGIYIAINPYRVGGTKDSDVSAYRHALIEFDKDLTLEEQLNLFTQMKLPAAAIIYSGGKSVHAWCRIDAQTRQEYDERVAMLFDHFESAGFHPDVKNKNPGRLSRLPHCIRFDKRQELLHLNPAASFSDWVQFMDGEELKPKRLRDYAAIDLKDKSNVLLGDDWILRGGSCVISAASGVGKSTLELQMAILFALGREFMGITPARALKSVILQAENDDRDNARTMLSILRWLGISEEFTIEEWDQVHSNVIIYDNYKCAEAFIADAQRIADKDRPDLMWLDPAAAFVGDDITKQTVIAKFFRNGIHPIAKHSGCAWMVINHYTKPPGDQGARKGWTSSDQQYRGAGSYDLPGWARASVTVTEVSDGVFQFRLAKRGNRAGMRHPSGAPTVIAWMRQAPQPEIYWEQVDEPQEEASEDGKPAKQELGIADLLALVPVDGDILKSDLIADMRAKGFTKAGAPAILNRALQPGRNGEAPVLVINKVKRSGTNAAQMVSRNKEKTCE
jgi:RecA-family ATPase